MRWQCFDTSARLEHARNHQKAYCNKGMYVDNLCSELYSFPITLSQKQCQSIFQAHVTFTFLRLFSTCVHHCLALRNWSIRIPCRTAKRTGSFFFPRQSKIVRSSGTQEDIQESIARNARILFCKWIAFGKQHTSCLSVYTHLRAEWW